MDKIKLINKIVDNERASNRLNEVYECFTINTIMNIIYSSIENMFRNQPDILDPTTQSIMTEWNLGHHYSNELAKYLYCFDNDNDIIKPNYSRKRPDILFHKRGTNKFNFLVIELKKRKR